MCDYEIRTLFTFDLSLSLLSHRRRRHHNHCVKNALAHKKPFAYFFSSQMINCRFVPVFGFVATRDTPYHIKDDALENHLIDLLFMNHHFIADLLHFSSSPPLSPSIRYKNAYNRSNQKR